MSNICKAFEMSDKDKQREHLRKLVLVEKKRTSKWLAEQLGVNPSTVSKWCTNTSQPDVACLLKIADLLEVDLRELLVREYKHFYLAQN